MCFEIQLSHRLIKKEKLGGSLLLIHVSVTKECELFVIEGRFFFFSLCSFHTWLL